LVDFYSSPPSNSNKGGGDGEDTLTLVLEIGASILGVVIVVIAVMWRYCRPFLEKYLCFCLYCAFWTKLQDTDDNYNDGYR